MPRILPRVKRWAAAVLVSGLIAVYVTTVGVTAAERVGSGWPLWLALLVAPLWSALALGVAAVVVVAVGWVVLGLFDRRHPPTRTGTPSLRPRREPIPERVRHEVWRRDQGQCVDCGSRERLHFDHIVPVSKGGSNTTRNIELRCESCNLKKGARI
jgi:hypothetical protein